MYTQWAVSPYCARSKPTKSTSLTIVTSPTTIPKWHSICPKHHTTPSMHRLSAPSLPARWVPRGIPKWPHGCQVTGAVTASLQGVPDLDQYIRTLQRPVCHWLFSWIAFHMWWQWATCPWKGSPHLGLSVSTSFYRKSDMHHLLPFREHHAI